MAEYSVWRILGTVFVGFMVLAFLLTIGLGVFLALQTLAETWISSLDTAIDATLFASLVGLALAAFTFVASRGGAIAAKYQDEIKVYGLNEAEIGVVNKALHKEKLDSEIVDRNETWSFDQKRYAANITENYALFVEYWGHKKLRDALLTSFVLLVAGLTWSLTVDLAISSENFSTIENHWNIIEASRQAFQKLFWTIDIVISLICLFGGLLVFAAAIIAIK